jgi:hypothetical protein
MRFLGLSFITPKPVLDRLSFFSPYPFLFFRFNVAFMTYLRDMNIYFCCKLIVIS